MLKFKIITPEQEVFADEIDQLTVMTRDGEITIMPNHIPLVSILMPGELKYKKNGEEYPMAVSGGFVEVRPDNVVAILADTAEMAKDIDLERAEAAKTRAQKALEDVRGMEHVDFAGLHADLHRASNRIKVGKKYRRLPPS